MTPFFTLKIIEKMVATDEYHVYKDYICFVIQLKMNFISF